MDRYSTFIFMESIRHYNEVNLHILNGYDLKVENTFGPQIFIDEMEVGIRDHRSKLGYIVLIANPRSQINPDQNNLDSMLNSINFLHIILRGKYRFATNLSLDSPHSKTSVQLV